MCNGSFSLIFNVFQNVKKVNSHGVATFVLDTGQICSPILIKIWPDSWFSGFYRIK